MINHFLDNPFLNSPLGNRRYAQYANSHFKRVRAAFPGGEFDAVLTAGEAAYTTFLKAIEQNATAKAAGGKKRLTNDEAMAQVKRFLARKAGVLADLFTSPDGLTRGEDTPAYAEFYPGGVSEYSRALKSDIETLANRYANVARTQAAAVGPKLEADTRALVQQVVESRGAQLLDRGTEKDSSTQGQTERTALAVCLFTDLLTLLIHFKTTPATAGTFFDQGLLRVQHAPPAAAAPVPAPAA